MAVCGSGRDKDPRLLRAPHPDRVAKGRLGPLRAAYPHRAGVRDAAWARFPGHHDVPRLGHKTAGVKGPAHQVCRKGERAGRIRAQTDGENAVREAGKVRPGIVHPARRVSRVGDALRQIQGAAIAALLDLDFRGADVKVAQRLVGPVVPGHGGKRVLGQKLGLLDAVLRQEPAHPGQLAKGRGIDPVHGFSGIERILVELEAVLGRAAKDHRAQPAVPQRKRLRPVARGPGVPQFMFLLHRKPPLSFCVISRYAPGVMPSCFLNRRMNELVTRYPACLPTSAIGRSVAWSSRLAFFSLLMRR